MRLYVVERHSVLKGRWMIVSMHQDRIEAWVAKNIHDGPLPIEESRVRTYVPQKPRKRAVTP